MARLLLLAGIVLVIYLLIRFYVRRPPGDKTPAPAQDMVRCDHCGVHLPKAESIVAGGHYYCSEAHCRESTGKPDHPDAG